MTYSIQESYEYTSNRVLIPCTNGNTITEGKAVFLNGSGDAQVADATTPSEFPDGLLQVGGLQIVTHGHITLTGHSLGSAGDVLYLDTSTDGDLTTTRPTTPDDDYIIRMGVIVDANTVFVTVKVEDKIGGGGSGNSIILSNGLSGSTTLGLVYYINTDGALAVADKDSDLRGRVFVMGTGNAGEGVKDGEITLSGLTANTVYYLSDNGAISATPVSAASDIHLRVGWSISTTLFIVNFSDPILL